MAAGILLSMVLGVTWVLIGVVLTKVARSNTSATAFYMCGCWLAAGFSWAFIADWPALSIGTPHRTVELSLWLGLSGILNSLGQLLLVKALNSGHKPPLRNNEIMKGLHSRLLLQETDQTVCCSTLSGDSRDASSI